MNKPPHVNRSPRSQTESLATRLTEGAESVAGASRSSARVALIRDIYVLLNTRRTSIPLAFKPPHLTDSLLTFGLKDAAGARACDTKDMCDDIRDTLTRHEPRLKDVNVQGLSSQVESEDHVSIRITATLREGDGDPLMLQLNYRTSGTRISVEEVST